MLWLALGCSLFPSSTPPETRPEPVPRTALTLASLGIELEVEGSPSMSPRGDGGVTLSFSRGRGMTIAPAGPSGLFSEVVDLTPDVQLHYAIQEAEGGMGGPESHLSGTVVSGEGLWDVTCMHQIEEGKPDARWCFEVLATLRPWQPER